MNITPASPAFAQPTGTTPGAYLRACRRRARLSVSDCAERIAFALHDQLHAEAELTACENDEPGDYSQLVRHLQARRVFAFDPGTFAQLAAATCNPELPDLAA